MAEAYTVAVDAYLAGSVRSGKVKAKKKLQLPWYLKPVEKVKGASGKALWDSVDGMMRRLGAG